jgi:hypothetical protein
MVTSNSVMLPALLMVPEYRRSSPAPAAVLEHTLVIASLGEVSTGQVEDAVSLAMIPLQSRPVPVTVLETVQQSGGT